MPLLPDLQYQGNAIGLGMNLPSEPEKPDEAAPPLLDTFAAASRQTLPGALYDRLSTPDPDEPVAPPGWDALDNLAGYEEFAHRATSIQTPSELAGWKGRIDNERADRQTLSRAGMTGFGATVAMTALDPSFLASIAVPELALARGVRTARAVSSALQGAAAGGAYEVGMQALQETRTPLDSMVSVGGGALLGGILGGLVGRVPSKEMRVIRQAYEQELQRSEAGAAAVARPTTLAAESLATGGDRMTKIINSVPLMGTDLDKVMASESITAKQTLQELADIPGIVGKNEENIATPASVESFVGRWDAQLADFSDTLNSNWKAYRARTPSADRLTKSDFYAAVSGAARRGDQHVIPEVAQSAKVLRSSIFDGLSEPAAKLKLFGEAGKPDSPLGATSYFRRMYDREAIRANRAAWDSMLVGHFMKDGNEAEARAAAADVSRTILRGDVGQANFNTQVMVPEAGPLKGRVLDVPDELLEPFLVNDPMKVASAYVRELAPQVELAKRFGESDMKDALSKVSQEYDIKREAVRKAAGDENVSDELTRLEQQEKSVVEALVRVRDRVLGTAGRLAPDASDSVRRAVTASRNWRNIVASGKLGVTAITGGVMDTARIAAQYGFLPTMKNLTKLIASPEFRALSKAQARRAGSAVEAALSRRVMVAYDGAITEGWSQTLANGLYKWTGLNHITDFNRTLGASLLEDKILKVAAQVAEGGRPKQFDLTRLASLGIDEDALRGIHAQFTQHGGETGGTRLSGSADWDNKALGDLYDAAILRESKIVVQQPGAADRVWWMDKEIGKFFGQLKTFSLSTPMRMAIAPVQMAGQGQHLQAARFVGYMMMGGYLTHSLRQLVAGKTPETDPSTAALEAFTETGLAGVLPDILSPFARAAGFNGGARYSDRNIGSVLGGPAVGAGQDVLQASTNAITDLHDALSGKPGSGFTAKDLHAVRRLLPWQNAWMFRRGINAMEGELAEGLELKGADSANFGQRLLRTDALIQDSGGP